MTGPPSEVVVGTNYSVGLKMFYGRGFCTNDFMYWEDNSSSSYTTIPAVDTDLDCHGAVCSAPASTSYVYQTLDWEGVGFYGFTR